MNGKRWTEALVFAQTLVIIGLLSWFYYEGQANAFLRTWLSQNFPLGLLLFSGLAILGMSGALLGAVLLWIIKNERSVLGPYGSRPFPMSRRRESGTIEDVRLKNRILGKLPSKSGVLLIVSSTILAAAAFTERTILAFIGLGLFFLALMPLYLSSQNGIQETVRHPSLSKAMRSSQLTGTRIVYAPLLEDRKDGQEIFAVKVRELPPPVLLGSTDNKKGRKLERISAPGGEVLKRLEDFLGLDFSEVKPSFLAKRLPTALAKLSLATSATVENAGDRFIVRMAGSPFARACEDLTRLDSPTDSLGCELCTAIALAFAKSSRSPVVIEDTVASAITSQIETTYRLLSSEEATSLALGSRQ